MEYFLLGVSVSLSYTCVSIKSQDRSSVGRFFKFFFSNSVRTGAAAPKAAVH